MADMMTFPDTVEEFMEEYKLVDTEQVYTNGTELVPIFRMKQWFEHEKAQLSREGTTSDTISRQEALEKVRAMQTYKLFMGDDMILVDKAEVQTELMMLPPAQPEPQEGHWIPHETPDGGKQYECSECGVLWEFNDGTPKDNEAYYCPKCGTKMKGEQDGH